MKEHDHSPRRETKGDTVRGRGDARIGVPHVALAILCVLVLAAGLNALSRPARSSLETRGEVDFRGARRTVGQPATTRSPATEHRAESVLERDGIYIKDVDRVTFDGVWPLVVPRATLLCQPLDLKIRGLHSLVVRYNGVDYALNGTATVHWPGAADIRPIWLDREDVPGAKVDTSDLIAAAASLCTKAEAGREQ